MLPSMAVAKSARIVLLLLLSAALSNAQSPPNEQKQQTASTPTPVAGQKPPAADELTPGTTVSEEQIRALIRAVADKDIENDKRSRDYTYVQREEQRNLDGKGRVKSTESKTYDVLMLYGEQVLRLTARNDQPLSAKDAAKQDEKIQKLIDKRKNESDDDRKKRLAKEEKEREDGRKFVREVADAYKFRMMGAEQLDGRDTYVIDATPKPDYRPKMKEAKILPKFRFRIWIDKAESEWVKLDATCIDTVSFGLFLARLHKGSEIVIETTRVNDEVWLPKHINVKVDARLALLKNFDVEEDIQYRDYKKFRADARIVGMAEEKPAESQPVLTKPRP